VQDGIAGRQTPHGNLGLWEPESRVPS
jgi:hypothetical protein